MFKSISLSKVTNLRLKLLANGFHPNPVHPHNSLNPSVKSAGKQPMLSGWDRLTREAPTEDEIISWSQNWNHNIEDQNTGIALTSELVAVDLDYTDEDLAATVYEKTIEILGHTDFIRIGKAPKRVLLYRVDETLENSYLKKLADGSGQGVDILTRPREGQARQIVAFGTHPETLQPFHWPLENPLDSDISEVPIIENSQESIERFLVALNDIAPFRSGASLTASEKRSYEDIIRDADGKITDGRDGYLKSITYKIGCDYFERHGVDIEASMLADLAWKEFTDNANVCDVSGKQKWNYGHALGKAEYLVKRVAQGHRTWGVSSVTRIAPYHDDTRIDVDTARDVTRNTIETFLRASATQRAEELVAYHVAMDEYEASGGVLQKPVAIHAAPKFGLKPSTGIGKTTIATEILIKLLAEGVIKKAVLSINTHVAADEKVELARQIANDLGAQITVHTWYGKDYENPRDASRSVCDKKSEYSAIRRSGGDAEKLLCSTCEFASSCYAKFQEKLQAELWIVPTATLTNPPRKITDADIIVIDEELAPSLVWGIGTIGDEENRPSKVPLSLLERDWKIRGKDTNDLLQSMLTSLLGTLTTPVDAEGVDQYVKFEEIALSADEIADAHKMLWAYKRDDVAYKSGDTTEDITSQDAAKWNLELRKLASLLKELENIKRKKIVTSGRIKIIHGEHVDLGKYTVAELCGMKSLGKQVLNKPILRIDATMRPAIEREIFEDDIEFLEEDISVETPHMEVIQAPISASKYSVKSDGNNPNGRLTHVQHMIEIMRSQSPNGSLTITYKDAAQKLKKNLPLFILGGSSIKNSLVTVDQRLQTQDNIRPDDIEIGQIDGHPRHPGLSEEAKEARHDITNFKAHRGIDEWKDVDTLFIYGRTRPNEEKIEKQAMAITGSYFEHQEYVKAERGFTMVDGSQRGIEVDEHPDAFCDQVLQMNCDDELIQAIGRARGVNRTEHNKVKIILMANRVLPIAVSKVVGAAELYPDRMEVALARNDGVLITNSKLLSEKFPDLWSSEAACKMDIHRNDLESNKTLLEVLIGKCNFLKTGRISQEGINKPSTYIALAGESLGKVQERLQAMLPDITNITGLDQFASVSGLATPTGFEPRATLAAPAGVEPTEYLDLQVMSLKSDAPKADALPACATPDVAQLDRASAFQAEREHTVITHSPSDDVSKKLTDISESPPDIKLVRSMLEFYDGDGKSEKVPVGFPSAFGSLGGITTLSTDIPWPDDYKGLLSPPEGLANGGVASLSLVDTIDDPPPDKVAETKARLAEYCVFVGWCCSHRRPTYMAYRKPKDTRDVDTG